MPLEEILEPNDGVVGVPVTRDGKPLGLGAVLGPDILEGVFSKRGVLRVLVSLGDAAVEVLEIRPIFSISAKIVRYKVATNSHQNKSHVPVFFIKLHVIITVTPKMVYTFLLA